MSEHETSPAPTDSTLQDVADRLYHWHSDPSPVTIIDREIMGHLAAIVDAHIAGESPPTTNQNDIGSKLVDGELAQVDVEAVRGVLTALRAYGRQTRRSNCRHAMSRRVDLSDFLGLIIFALLTAAMIAAAMEGRP